MKPVAVVKIGHNGPSLLGENPPPTRKQFLVNSLCFPHALVPPCLGFKKYLNRAFSTGTSKLSTTPLRLFFVSVVDQISLLRLPLPSPRRHRTHLPLKSHQSTN